MKGIGFNFTKSLFDILERFMSNLRDVNTMKYLLLIFLSVILVMSIPLVTNQSSFGYGGGGGSGGKPDPRVCGDKLCSEIPGGRSAWEEKSELMYQEKSKISYFPPPLKQFKDGIEPSHVTCTEGLELLLKQSNGKPVCLKPTSVVKLVERGWAIHVLPE